MFAMQGHEFDYDAVNAETGHAHMRDCWPAWETAFNTVDPAGNVPVFINNFSCYATVFHGIEYPWPEGYPTTASDTVPWAVRISEYLLSFVNCGAVGAGLNFAMRGVCRGFVSWQGKEV